MGGIGAVIRGDAPEQILIMLPWQQVAVIERRSSEIRQKRITRAGLTRTG